MGIADRDTTLGDLNRLDRDNYAHIDNKDCKTYAFPSYKFAVKFMGQAFDNAMRKCGVKVRVGMASTKIDRMMKSRGVKVEHREYGQDEILYRSGIFIYDNREIAAFISNPFVREGNIIDLYEKYHVRTNVKGVF
ncbi:MAG: hypothetical protein DRH26_00055 [Deltaproteobacteria bacterium]|nr:MAG: hypothetical protein DRH26_00055 [Deltaproteobacteria bacterium]